MIAGAVRSRLIEVGRQMIAAGWTVSPSGDWFGWEAPDGVWFCGDSPELPPPKAAYHHSQHAARWGRRAA